MRRLAHHLCLLALTLAPLAWLLVTNPFAWPMLMTGAEGIAARIEAKMARAVSTGELEARLAEAVTAKDNLTAEALLEVAAGRGVVLPEALAARADALMARDAGPGQVARACASCAYDIGNCRSLTQVASCNFPVELTPLGDANALRRQTMIALTGGEVDRLEAGLALVGLGATTLVVVTGGASATIKAGATAGRLARRMGAVTPGLQKTIGHAADLPVRWGRIDDYLIGRAPLEEVTDSARLARLSGYATDFGRVAENTSLTETLDLLRHVDDEQDIARLVRVSDATGERTRGTFALLGKNRVFRALDEIGVLLRWLAAAVLAVATWLAGLFLQWVLRRVRRRIAQRFQYG